MALALLLLGVRLQRMPWMDVAQVFAPNNVPAILPSHIPALPQHASPRPYIPYAFVCTRSFELQVFIKHLLGAKDSFSTRGLWVQDSAFLQAPGRYCSSRSLAKP